MLIPTNPLDNPITVSPQKEKTILLNYLTADLHLVLHTRVAQQLLKGQWQSGPMGLLQFANLMVRLWRAYKEDDAYAEWYLLKTYEALEETKVLLKHHESRLQEQLNQIRGLEITLFKHPTPLKQPLRFGTPFAYMAARLIEQVDYINRQLFTLKQLGLMPRNDLTPGDLMREIQKIFHIARAWRYTGITRQDIFEKTQKAKQVQELLGEVPLPILNKEIQVAFLTQPKLREG